MWNCMRCTARLAFSSCKPAIDSFGCYFLCPRCNYRNVLKNVGKQSGPMQFMQVDDVKDFHS